MIEYEDEGYYFDRIHILSRIKRPELVKHLSSDKLKTDCRSFDIINTDRERGVYRSRIEVVAPTQDFLEFLYSKESLLGSGYKISYIEITHDKFCESAGDAELKADILFDTVRKRYSVGYIYEGKLIKTRKERINDVRRGLFARRTFYSSWQFENGNWGKKERKKSNRFKYIIYARRSKINNRHCVHREWRIVGAGLIALKTGIRSIGGIVQFDFKKFFKIMDAKYIVYERINYEALGKWLEGYDGRKVLNQRQMNNLDSTAQCFLQIQMIETFSDLIRWWKDEKDIIKEKQGKRSAWDKKILALRDCGRFKAVQ